MKFNRKIAVAVLAALTLGGVGAGATLASASAPTPAAMFSPFAQTAQNGPQSDAPEPGDTPDAAGENEAAEGPEAPEAGETQGGPDTDNIQHEGAGDEGGHADKLGAPTEGK